MTLLKIFSFKTPALLSILFCVFSSCGRDNALMNKGAPGSMPAVLSCYKTDDRGIPVHNIINKYRSGEFIPVGQDVLNAGIAKQYYWIHFNISNIGNKASNQVIDIDNARLNELELFEAQDSIVQSLGKLGDFQVFSQRSILHKNFIYRVSFQPGQTKDYFLFVNQVGHTFVLPVKIYTEKKFGSTTFKDYLSDGITYGILLFVAVLSFLFFLTSRQYLYLFYGLYIISATVWFMSYFGLGYQYLWGNNPGMNTAMPPAMSSLNIFLNLQICQILLRLPKTKRSLNTIANLTKSLLLVLAIFPFLFNLTNYGYAVNHSYLVVFLLTILVAMVVVSSAVFLSSMKGVVAARLYLAASLLKATGITNLALLELGIAPVLYNVEAFLQIGIFVEIILLTYALAMRYTSFRARAFVRIIEAHENERTRISKEIHDGISSSLTGINYGIKNFTRDTNIPPEKKIQLEKVLNELNKVELEARSISHNTMPDFLKKRTITNIVSDFIEEIQAKAANNAGTTHFININFSANEQPGTFSEAVKLNIFRIIQEIVTNILKHSKATNADILFSFSKKDMLIIAEDNGVGFGDGNRMQQDGMGIKNIRARIELLDGTLSLKSPVHKQNSGHAGQQDNPVAQAAYGTLIKIKIPYKNNLLKNKEGYEQW